MRPSACCGEPGVRCRDCPDHIRPRDLDLPSEREGEPSYLNAVPVGSRLTVVDYFREDDE